MDMVEKVARAILKRRFYDCEPDAYDNDLDAFYENLDPDHVIDAHDEARAAIEAIPLEPPLTCPHIDAAIASGELSGAVKDELATIRDINSQLRYATWALMAQRDDALSSKGGEQ